MKMIKLTTLFVSCCVIFTLSSCKPKHEKLIDKYMYENLYDYESYQPMFTDKEIRSDTAIIYEENSYNLLVNYCNEAEKNYNSVADYPNLYSIERRQLELDTWKKQIEELQKYIDAYIPKIEYYALQEFRCKNKGGNFDKSTWKFVFNKDGNEIIRVIQNPIKTTIKK